MAKEKQIQAKIVTYNNKGRTGKYVYIKEKNKLPSRYKYTGGSINQYINRYQQRKPRTKPDKLVQEARRIAKQPDISTSIAKGKTTAKLFNLKTASNYKIYKAQLQMLKPLVKDLKLLQILAKTENIRKMKWHIETKAQLIGTQGRTLAEITK